MLPAMPNNDQQGEPPSGAKTERLEARIRPDVKELIERAAVQLGTTVSDFVVQSCFDHAVQVVERFEMVRLSREQSKAFVEALANPPDPSPALIHAMVQYRSSFDGRR